MFDKVKIAGILVNVFFLLASFNLNASNNIEGSVRTTVFFNAASHEIVIINPVSTSYLVQVFDLTGVEINSLNVGAGTSNTRLSTSEMSRGIYLVRVSPVSDAITSTFKILVR